jgi:CHAT domain-containing protein
LARLVQTGRLSESLAPLAAPLTALLGPAAGEPAVRAALAAPHRYLVFATHGLLDAELPYVLEPSLALTLVGADATDPAADGFLTLTEVMGLKLSAELAVLGASRSGIGKEQRGEGHLSMGWAFQVAGARQVLMTLWSGDEPSTVYMIERLFHHLKELGEIPEALERARADLREAGWSHPFYWAAFVLMGA